MIALSPSFLIEEGVSGTKPLSEWPAGKEFLSKLDRMFRSALDPLTVFKAFQEKAGRFTASASRAVVEARGCLRAGVQRRSAERPPSTPRASELCLRKRRLLSEDANPTINCRIFHCLLGDV
jgi:hypothetical protein